MKRRNILILTMSILGVSLLGIAGGATYAGYARGQEIRQGAATKRYLFLDGASNRSGDLTDGSNWDTETPNMYIYAWENGSTDKYWFESGGTVVDNTKTYHWFYIPTSFVNIIFVRINPAAASPSFENGVIWGQTSDLTATNSNNLYTITYWHSESGDKSNTDPARGAWSVYNPNVS